jgi:hypothetical protein
MHRYSRIVAIDLGKFNSVLCVFDPATAAHSFASFASDRQTMHDRLAEHATADPARTLVVFEFAGWALPTCPDDRWAKPTLPPPPVGMRRPGCCKVAWDRTGCRGPRARIVV